MLAAVLVYKKAVAMSDAFSPFPLEESPVGPHEKALSMATVVHILAEIPTPIRPAHCGVALETAVDKLPGIPATIGPGEDAVAMTAPVDEITGVTLGSDETPSAVPHARLPLSIVHAPVRPHEATVAMLAALAILAHVYMALWPAHDGFALEHVGVKLPRVAAAVGPRLHSSPTTQAMVVHFAVVADFCGRFPKRILGAAFHIGVAPHPVIHRRRPVFRWQRDGCNRRGALHVSCTGGQRAEVCSAAMSTIGVITPTNFGRQGGLASDVSSVTCIWAGARIVAVWRTRGNAGDTVCQDRWHIRGRLVAHTGLGPAMPYDVRKLTGHVPRNVAIRDRATRQCA
mmetsp:Transcript_80874/g.225045  ORF Transcript_80874/g.225045 Transcript_80874/m.225045 type:complete len:342 (-) Transcript_80874:2-1027(-)